MFAFTGIHIILCGVMNSVVYLMKATSPLSTCDDMKYIRLFVAWFMQCTLLMYSHIVLYSLFLKLQLRFVVAAFT